MPHSGPPARAHLRLASRPAGRRASEGHLALLLRALAVRVAVVWMTAVAWLSAAVTLLPLVWRRAPLGRRLNRQPRRDARVIPFQPRRQALPR